MLAYYAGRHAGLAQRHQQPENIQPRFLSQGSQRIDDSLFFHYFHCYGNNGGRQF